MTKQTPMLFNAAMVKAIMDGTKGETRRILKDQPDDEPAGGAELIDGQCFWLNGFDGSILRPVKGAKCLTPGTLVWVKETWRPREGHGAWDFYIRYDADKTEKHFADGDADVSDWTWPKAAKTGNVSSLFMPKFASRLTLLVTDYRIERLHQIDEDGARNEGFPAADGLDDNGNPARWSKEIPHPKGGLQAWECARDWYADLWDDINGIGSWDQNPWVEVIKFDTIHRNIVELME